MKRSLLLGFVLALVCALAGQAIALAEPIELVYPSFKVGSHNDAVIFAEQVAEFNQRFEGKYHLVVEEIPGSELDYVAKLKMLNAADDLPLFVELNHDPALAELIIEKDKLVDLTPYMDATPEWKDICIEESLAYNTVDGKIIATPKTATAYVGIFWNKELFAQAGLEAFPETIEEFWDCCEALQAKGITPIALHTGDAGWCANIFLNARLAVTQEGQDFIETKYPTNFDLPVVIDAIADVQRLFTYTTGDAVGNGYAVAANNFCSGKTAMVPNGPWMKSIFSDPNSAPEGFVDKVGYATFPDYVMLDNESLRYGVAISKKYSQEEIEGAVEFLKMVNSEEWVKKEMIFHRGLTPPYVSLTDEERTQLDRLTLEIMDVTATKKITAPIYQMKWDTVTLNETIPTELPSLALGELTPEEYAQKLSKSAAKFVELNIKK